MARILLDQFYPTISVPFSNLASAQPMLDMTFLSPQKLKVEAAAFSPARDM